MKKRVVRSASSSRYDSHVNKKVWISVVIVVLLIGLLVGAFWYAAREEGVVGRGTDAPKGGLYGGLYDTHCTNNEHTIVSVDGTGNNKVDIYCENKIVEKVCDQSTLNSVNVFIIPKDGIVLSKTSPPYESKNQNPYFYSARCRKDGTVYSWKFCVTKDSQTHASTYFLVSTFQSQGLDESDSQRFFCHNSNDNYNSKPVSAWYSCNANTDEWKDYGYGQKYYNALSGLRPFVCGKKGWGLSEVSYSYPLESQISYCSQTNYGLIKGIGKSIGTSKNVDVLCAKTEGEVYKWVACTNEANKAAVEKTSLSTALIGNFPTMDETKFLCEYDIGNKDTTGWWICDAEKKLHGFVAQNDQVLSEYRCLSGAKGWLSSSCNSGDVGDGAICIDGKWNVNVEGCSGSSVLSSNKDVLCQSTANTNVKFNLCSNSASGKLGMGNDQKMYTCVVENNKFIWKKVCDDSYVGIHTDHKNVLCAKEYSIFFDPSIPLLVPFKGTGDVFCSDAVNKYMLKDGKLPIVIGDIPYSCDGTKWVNKKYSCESYCGAGCKFKSCGNGKYCDKNSKCVDAELIGNSNSKKTATITKDESVLFKTSTDKVYKFSYVALGLSELSGTTVVSNVNWLKLFSEGKSYKYVLQEGVVKVDVTKVEKDSVTFSYYLTEDTSTDCFFEWFFDEDSSKVDGKKEMSSNMICSKDINPAKGLCATERKANAQQVYAKGAGKYLDCISDKPQDACVKGKWYFRDGTTLKGPYEGCGNPDGSSTGSWCPVQTTTGFVYQASPAGETLGYFRTCTDGDAFAEANAQVSKPTTEKSCADTKDDDGDEKIDCNDMDCVDDATCIKELVCPVGSYPTGISGKAGWFVDSLQLLCTGDGHSDGVGGGGGSDFETFRCGGSDLLTSVIPVQGTYEKNTYLTQFTPYCSSSDFSEPLLGESNGDVTKATQEVISCASGQKLQGFKVSAGGTINKFVNAICAGGSCKKSGDCDASMRCVNGKCVAKEVVGGGGSGAEGVAVKGNVDCSVDNKIGPKDISLLKQYLYLSKQFTCTDSLTNAKLTCDTTKKVVDDVVNPKDLSVLKQYVYQQTLFPSCS